MQPIRGRGRGRERGGVDRRGRARDGGSGHGLDCDAPNPGGPLTTRQLAETLVNVG